ncbi:lysophospholipase L1-like esterase [Actinoplanes campanulatus]|uniref:Lysophospholipase L1-like esterase n=1 Tax=Actinoplanes campanulatus TaxID=113559 RepID=A0A7W5ARX9_9ACTN|nr:SGNH/GDSL hydrolase family protein [Actinoplanes campanulatus]MBB3101137.1 lysophospholipase L1-like esterase [Actinoplanes campanulatus]
MPYPTAIFRRVVAACAAMAMTSTAWAAPAAVAARATAPDPLQYVALGDSVAAGHGAAATGDACGRSSAAYPTLLARQARGSITLRFAACSGATTIDVATRQAATLSRETDLVTLTAGANDLGVKQVLLACQSPARVAACRTGYAAINRKLSSTLPRDLARMIRTVTTAAPNARVVVTGYPLPFARTRRCAGVPVQPALRVRSNQVIHQLNAAIAEAARQSRIRYVDVARPFTGHELCTARPWLIGAEGIRDNTVLHPTAAGQAKGYFPALVEAGLAGRP